LRRALFVMTQQETNDYRGIPGARKEVVETAVGEVAYITAGSGSPVLLLHGLGTTSETWVATIRALAATRRVVAPDLWGHGGSGGSRRIRSVEPLVEAVKALCDALGVDATAVVGHSLGGLVAMRFALAHKDRVTKLALVDAGGIGQEMSWLLRLASIPVIGWLVFSPAILVVKLYGWRAFNPPGDVSISLLKSLHRSRVTHISADAVRKAIRSGAERLGPASDSFLLPRLHEIEVPVNVYWGEQDRLFPVSQLHGLAEACPQVEIHLFPDVGHWPYAEIPELFNSLLVDFLDNASR
jgi:pimeloyl-ACP methyl ester carboxylesterase